jgi:ABC-type branched-subunit amino acid transport system substrate-binding protein
MSGRKIGRGRWLAVVVSVVLLGALVAPSAAAGGKFPAVNEPGVTANQIRVGGVATVTNDPTGNTLGTAFDGVDAYFAMINSTQKGVYGRKLVLDSKRDDQLGNNKQEVQGLISQDNVFAVLPVAVDLFSGADLLVQNKIPTFGVDIQAEWGSEENKPGPPNFFGQFGSFICFTCAQPSTSIWLAKKLGLTRVGVLALNIPQSKTACEGYVNSLKKYPVAKVVFTDSSLAFGATDYTSQVDGMIKKKVNFVITCIDGNGTVNLAREMKKQGLNAVQALPNAYDHKYIAKYADLLKAATRSLHSRRSRQNLNLRV